MWAFRVLATDAEMDGEPVAVLYRNESMLIEACLEAEDEAE